MSGGSRRRRIVHIVHSFSIGGLENVIVQLINQLPADQFEHVLLSLTSISDFKDRITQPGVRFIQLHKPPGHAVGLYLRIYRLLKELNPDVVHSCNLAALEIAPLSWLARIPLRVHAEHGWDSHDPKGESLRYQRIRRLYKPFVSHYVVVSKDIDDYLANAIGVPKSHRTLITNGVDTARFSPRQTATPAVIGCPFVPGHHWLIGTVGRLQTVKNQPLLARAFIHLMKRHPETFDRLRLIIVGDGPLMVEIQALLAHAGLESLAWLSGARNDVPDILRMLDCFVLPSAAEGTSCTLQEAMACGLPVVATAVGGTPELVTHGGTGFLVPDGDANAMAQAILGCYLEPEKAMDFGRRARTLALTQHGLSRMIERYAHVFSNDLPLPP